MLQDPGYLETSSYLDSAVFETTVGNQQHPLCIIDCNVSEKCSVHQCSSKVESGGASGSDFGETGASAGITDIETDAFVT